jgi:hypothetical protein
MPVKDRTVNERDPGLRLLHRLRGSGFRLAALAKRVLWRGNIDQGDLLHL